MIEQGRITLSGDKKYCLACANVLDARAELCPGCGVRQGTVVQPATASSRRFTAAMLAFFLGGFGVHRFYLGQIGFGIVYLLFCVTLVPVLLSLVDGIVLLSMSNEEFGRSYPQLCSTPAPKLTA